MALQSDDTKYFTLFFPQPGAEASNRSDALNKDTSTWNTYSVRGDLFELAYFKDVCV